MKRLIFTLLLTSVFGCSALGQAETCPKLDVTGGGVVQPGVPMSFTALIEDKTENPNLEYNWTVSNATIMSGQGTQSITVNTTGLGTDSKIKAEVKIKGLPENCLATASESGVVQQIRDFFPTVDEFGSISLDEVRVRLDFFLKALRNSPKLKPFIINYGPPQEIAKREKLIKDRLRLRKYDLSRITFVRSDKAPWEKRASGQNSWFSRRTQHLRQSNVFSNYLNKKPQSNKKGTRLFNKRVPFLLSAKVYATRRRGAVFCRWRRL